MVPTESIAARLTVNVPEPYEWLTWLPVAVVPSPKSKVNAYGPVPPNAVALKIMLCPGVGFEGLKDRLAARDGRVSLQAVIG